MSDWTGIAGMVLGAGGLLTVAVPRAIDAWPSHTGAV